MLTSTPRNRLVPGKTPLVRAAVALAAVSTLVVAARVAGLLLDRHGDHTHVGQTFPLAGFWRSGVTWWLLIPLAVGVALFWCWPHLVRTLRWRWLLFGATIVAALWASALALTDGPAGFTAPLASVYQYPHDVPLVHDLGRYLPTFNRHIFDVSPKWTTHVSGHPPGALGIFVLLDRIGLGGLGWGAAACVAGGALAVPGVLATTRELGGDDFARRAALFVPLAPTALWVASTADALFAGVAAAGLYALTLAVGRRDGRGDLLAAAGGLALGCCLFLSYGLSLLVVPAVGVVVVRRRIRPLLIGGMVVVALLLLWKLAGYDWWQGFGLAARRVRVPGGVWQARSTWYFLLGNPAALAISVGPVTVAGLALLRRTRLAVLPATIGLVVAAAIVSNLSKGEVERIYLPFMVWLLPFAATLPRGAVATRILVAVQLGWAVLITATVRTWW